MNISPHTTTIEKVILPSNCPNKNNSEIMCISNVQQASGETVLTLCLDVRHIPGTSTDTHTHATLRYQPLTPEQTRLTLTNHGISEVPVPDIGDNAIPELVMTCLTDSLFQSALATVIPSPASASAPTNTQHKNALTEINEIAQLKIFPGLLKTALKEYKVNTQRNGARGQN